MRVLALDAMGVLYAVGDDVRDVLTPFVRERGGAADLVDPLFWRVFSGTMTTAEFWREIGLDPSVEGDYLVRRTLMPGLLPFLEYANRAFDTVCCVSNDAKEWGFAQRRRFGLDRYIKHWFISGDVGLCKPDPKLFQRALDTIGATPGETTFVDDLRSNIAAAAGMGLNTVLFGPQDEPVGSWRHAETMAALQGLLERRGEEAR